MTNNETPIIEDEIVDAEFESVHATGEVQEEETPVVYRVPQLRTNTQRLAGGRNAPCPCGSGMKLKFCCGKDF